MQRKKLPTALLAMLLILLTSLLVFGCKKVEPRPKTSGPAESGISQVSQKITRLSTGYITDGTAALFENFKWYTYHFQTHNVWSHLDVFTLKTGSSLYNLQIISYQHPVENSRKGYYTIRYAEESAAAGIQQIEFDASACGTPFTNPDYQNCLKDPARNAHVYLNLKTGRTWKMTDGEAGQSKNWHIAFKRNKIKFNAGTDGPGDVLVALRQRDYSLLNDDLTGNISKLRDALAGDKGLSRFKSALEVSQYAFYPAKGASRVVYERYWYGTDLRSNTRIAKPQNWWIIKNAEGNSYTRFSINAIDEAKNGARFSSRLNFYYDIQTVADDAFRNQFQDLTVNDIQSGATDQELCFDFDSSTQIDCATGATKWDIKLVIKPEPNRAWHIYTNNGAYGPISRAKMERINSGRL